MNSRTCSPHWPPAEQLDRGDPELLQVLDGDRVSEAGIRASQLLGNTGVGATEPLDVGFIDDGLVPRRFGLTIVAPVEERIDDHASCDERRAVKVVPGVLRLAEMIGKDSLAPLPEAIDRLRVWIQQHLGRIAPLAILG